MSFPPPSWPVLPHLDQSVLLEALRSWAICAAMVPDATWDQLEAIRRHPLFSELHAHLPEPYYLQRLLDWTYQHTQQDPISGDGRTLALPPQLVDQLIREQRRPGRQLTALPPLEERMRQLLLQQLDPECPTEPMSRLWWELKVASHQMILNPEHAEKLLCRFFGSAVEAEAREIIEAELRRQQDGDVLLERRITPVASERLRSFMGTAEGVELGTLVWGHRRLWVRAAGIAMILTLMLGMAIYLADYAGSPWDFFLSQRQYVKRIIDLPETRKVLLGEKRR